MRALLLSSAFLLTMFVPLAAADGSCVWVNYAGFYSEWCEYEEGVVTETGEAVARSCVEYGLYWGGKVHVSCHYENEDDWHWGLHIPDPTDEKYEMQTLL